jgi:hypothetical protein
MPPRGHSLLESPANSVLEARTGREPEEGAKGKRDYSIWPEPTPEQEDLAVRLVVLRFLHDGEIVDYPIRDDDDLRAVFDVLEREGYLARWNRTWPLNDRYRLTEAGIAEIEKYYRPGPAENAHREMRERGLAPGDRQRWLRERGHDPFLWALLNDPYIDWRSWWSHPGPYARYVFEQAAPREPALASSGSDIPEPRVARPHLVDLDREVETDGEPEGDDIAATGEVS